MFSHCNTRDALLFADTKGDLLPRSDVRIVWGSWCGHTTSSATQTINQFFWDTILFSCYLLNILVKLSSYLTENTIWIIRKYQKEKVLVDIRRFSRNCIRLSYFNHYWNGSINFSQYLRYGVYRKYASFEGLDRRSKTLHQMKLVPLGHAKKCIRIWAINAHVLYKNLKATDEPLWKNMWHGGCSIVTEYECSEFAHLFQDRMLWRIACHTSMDLSYIKTQNL